MERVDYESMVIQELLNADDREELKSRRGTSDVRCGRMPTSRTSSTRSS